MPSPTTFTQANAAAECGVIDPSGVRPLATSPHSRRIRYLGPGGTATAILLGIAQANATGYCLQTDKVPATGPAVAVPGVATEWPAGDWTIRVNFNTANFNIDWVETRVWVLDNACAAIQQIGIDTTVRSLGVAGVQTVVIPCSAITPGDQATAYIQFCFTNNNAFMTQIVQITSNQLVDTPIITPTKRTMMGVMH